ncbi:MAG: AAA family ATPase [Candidatus Ventricola sp.]
MNRLYLVGGPMGVGKTAACQALKLLLHKSCFLDGDWCWDMHPFSVTPETKIMVMDNIVHLLSSFLRCSEIDHVIFGWVMHEQAIIDELLARLPLEDCEVVSVSLICDAATLTSRLQKDIDAGLRTPDVIGRSLARLEQYGKLNTCRIDTTAMTIWETAQAILALSHAAPDKEI